MGDPAVPTFEQAVDAYLAELKTKRPTDPLVTDVAAIASFKSRLLAVQGVAAGDTGFVDFAFKMIRSSYSELPSEDYTPYYKLYEAIKTHTPSANPVDFELRIGEVLKASGQTLESFVSEPHQLAWFTQYAGSYAPYLGSDDMGRDFKRYSDLASGLLTDLGRQPTEAEKNKAYALAELCYAANKSDYQGFDQAKLLEILKGTMESGYSAAQIRMVIEDPARLAKAHDALWDSDTALEFTRAFSVEGVAGRIDTSLESVQATPLERAYEALKEKLGDKTPDIHTIYGFEENIAFLLKDAPNPDDDAVQRATAVAYMFHMANEQIWSTNPSMYIEQEQPLLKATMEMVRTGEQGLTVDQLYEMAADPVSAMDFKDALVAKGEDVATFKFSVDWTRTPTAPAAPAAEGEAAATDATDTATSTPWEETEFAKQQPLNKLLKGEPVNPNDLANDSVLFLADSLVKELGIDNETIRNLVNHNAKYTEQEGYNHSVLLKDMNRVMRDALDHIDNSSDTDKEERKKELYLRYQEALASMLPEDQRWVLGNIASQALSGAPATAIFEGIKSLLASFGIDLGVSTPAGMALGDEDTALLMTEAFAVKFETPALEKAFREDMNEYPLSSEAREATWHEVITDKILDTATTANEDMLKLSVHAGEWLPVMIKAGYTVSDTDVAANGDNLAQMFKDVQKYVIDGRNKDNNETNNVTSVDVLTMLKVRADYGLSAFYDLMDGEYTAPDGKIVKLENPAAAISIRSEISKIDSEFAQPATNTMRQTLLDDALTIVNLDAYKAAILGVQDVQGPPAAAPAALAFATPPMDRGLNH